MNPNFRDLVEGSASAGWDWFEKAETLFGDRSKITDAQGEERRRLSEATARVFASEDGALLMSYLKGATIDRVTFVTQLGIDPQQALLYGAFREGQNALYVAMARLAHEGRRDTPETAPIRRE